MTDKEFKRKIEDRFPRRKSENIAKVLKTALFLKAISSALGQKRRKFESMGVSSSMITSAVDIKILERTKTNKFRFLVSDRYTKPIDLDYDELVNYELKNLFHHIDKDHYVVEHLRKLLKLPDDISIEEIKELLMSGPTNKKIYRYDRIFLSLKDNNLIDEEYDYLHLGFRVKAARYWLSPLGKELLNAA